MSIEDRSDPLLEEAMDWLLRLQESPGDAALAAACERWAGRDAAHGRAWARAMRAWALVGEVPPAHVAQWSGTPAMDGASPVVPTPRRRMLAGLAFGAAAACLAVAVLPDAVLRLRADEATATGESRRVTLADGTVIHLAPRSAMAVRYTAATRGVTLLAGEAFFEVAPAPDRPFIVSAEGLEVRVIGTAFDLRLAGDQLEVAVQHGHVRLFYDRMTPPLQADLTAGERMRVALDGGAATRGRLSPTEVAGWRDGMLFVQDATVAEVVEVLRRYHAGWVLLRDERLAARRVTGLYDLRDIGRALRALAQPHGGQVREVTPLLYIMTGNS
jgi:transmembrane sensor